MYTLNDGSFDSIALDLFRFQAENNPIYSDFIRHLRVNLQEVDKVEDIPFLPITFFKNHPVKTGHWSNATVFSSSGTSMQSSRSLHYIDDLDFYRRHALSCFNSYLGDVENYHIMALLPSYLERSDSSLVSMVEHLIRESESEVSGFYLHDLEKLKKDIERALKRGDRQVLLWGVSFALLDLVETGPFDLSDCAIIETGGMKGRRKEITRQELYEVLRFSFNARDIYSEYGMTELLSQAYSHNDGRFRTPAYMRAIGREIGDPRRLGVTGKSAGLNIIDLANAHSIAFIETEDMGNVYTDGSFDVLGRLDNSDLRGCNLMV